VDISFTVCVFVFSFFFVCLYICLFVRLHISPPRIKLVVSNFVWGSSASKTGNVPFLRELCSPRSPKSDESASGRMMNVSVGDSPLVCLSSSCCVWT